MGIDSIKKLEREDLVNLYIKLFNCPYDFARRLSSYEIIKLIINVSEGLS